MNECAKKCVRQSEFCKECGCRMWISYADDLNCTLIAVNKNGKMTLAEAAKRLNLSIVRVKQIQDLSLIHI